MKKRWIHLTMIAVLLMALAACTPDVTETDEFQALQASHDAEQARAGQLESEKEETGTKLKETEKKLKDTEKKLREAENENFELDKELKELKKEVEPYLALSKAEAEAKKAQLEEEKARKKAEEEAKKAEEQARKEEEKRQEEERKKEEEARGYETGITYDQLARTPDDHIGKKVKFEGRIIQVMEGSTITHYRLAVNDNYDTVAYLESDTNQIGNERILDDDYVTVYGLSYGLHSYTSTMGGQITIPAIIVDYFE